MSFTESQPRVLYVEDDSIDRMALKRKAREERWDFDLTLVGSATEARRALEDNRYDVVLSDYNLGDGNALDLVDSLNGAALVVVTGGGDEALAVAAMKRGAADYIVKDSERTYLRDLPRIIEHALRVERAESHNRLLSHALMSTYDAVFIADSTGTIIWINKAFEGMYGYEPSEVLGRKASELLSPHTEDGRSGLEVHHCRKDGSECAVDLSVSTMELPGAPGPFTVYVSHDVSERRAAEAALRQSEERYALAVQGANDGLWDWDLVSQKIYFSPRWKGILGYADDELKNERDEWFSRIHTEDLTAVTGDLDAHLRGESPHFASEYRVRHRDGHYIWVLSRGLAVRDEAGKPYRMAGSITDITVRRKMEETLFHHAFHDPLTGLPNRALFRERLQRAFALSRRRRDYVFGLLFLDLDRFKIVNDSLGHMLGDELLVSIARRIQTCLRPTDTVARLGGDEFAVLIEDVQEGSDARRVADRIQKELVLPYHLGGHEVFSSASMGIALSTDAYDTPEDLIRAADTAMYRAKAQGRARHVLFHTDMQSRAMEALRLESDLRRAIERREFEVFFQPVVSLDDFRITGVEALLRWRQPMRGLIPPSEFISLAEETGLINAIGEWVLMTSCMLRSTWKQAGLPDLVVMVNVSARQFQHDSLSDLVRRAVRETGVDPQRIVLEITESTAMLDVDMTASILSELCDMGVRIAIDDFGTGYSSLACLRRFPIHTIKVDRSFVRGLGGNTEDAAITRAIIAIAHSLKMRVVAEGVETEEEVNFLHDHGCDAAQGYLFSRPLPAGHLIKLLSRTDVVSPGSISLAEQTEGV